MMRAKQTRLGIVSIVLVFLLIVASACSSQQRDTASGGSPATSDAGSKETGGSAAGGGSSGGSAGKSSITIILGTEPGTLDPAFGNGPSEFIPIANMMEGLFTPGENLEITPVLAESYTIIDELTWEFKLREGVRFHNGEPFNAEAVRYTYERTRDPENNVRNVWWDDINLERIEVVDDYTVRFHTSEPTPHMLARLANDNYIFEPKHYEENDQDNLSRNPVGTGPYKIKEWRVGDRIVLEANEDYWGGAPSIKEVVFRFIPEEGTRIAELEAGHADIIFGISPENVPLLEANQNVQVIGINGGRRVYLGIKTKPEDLPTAKKEVRQALNYGLDIESITASLLGGKTKRMPTPINPPNVNPDIKKYTYDPERARQLLASAGYPNGFDVTLDAYLGDVTKDREFLQAIVDSYRQIGINVTLNIVEKSNFNELLKNRTTNELYLRSTGPAFDLGEDLNLLDPNHRGNGTMYDSPHFLEAFDAVNTIMDPEKRQEWGRKIQEIIAEDAPWVFLWNEVEIYGLTKRVQGFDPQGDERIRVHQLSLQE